MAAEAARLADTHLAGLLSEMPGDGLVNCAVGLAKLEYTGADLLNALSLSSLRYMRVSRDAYDTSHISHILHYRAC